MAPTKPVTPLSPSFRHSVHLIPSPDHDGKRPNEFRPLIFRWYVWGYHSGIMVVLAIAIEVALFFSNKNNGFKVHETNVLSFGGHVSSQFLLSFFPTLLIAPIPLLMDSIWFWFRVYQPYITLAQGDADAEDSVNANYLAYNKIQAIIRARKYSHRVLYTTGILSLGTLLFQPLASSFFELKNYPTPSDFSNLKTEQSIGIPTDIVDLTAFVAAAGYVSASVAQPLGDPPFVNGNWTTATFAKPAIGDYSTVPIFQVNTTGVQTFPQCDMPDGNVSVSLVGTTVTLNATANAGFGTASGDPCTGSLTFPLDSSTQQYGAVNVTGCATNGSTAETVPELQPVMLWFFNANVNGQHTGAVVFCKPTIKVSNVQANITIANMTLSDIKVLGGYTADNNVTGGTNQGRAYNGLIFSNFPDAFVAARANTVKSVLPGAILKFASLQSGGLQYAFQNQNVFLNYTRTLYQRHLAIAAQGAYFIPADTTLSARQIQLLARLIISTPIAHVLAALLFVTGIMSAFLHVKHRRARSRLFLAHTPGSLASTVALTGRSGFGDLLVPYETDDTLAEKLEPLRFRLDERTGAVLADTDGAYAPGRRGSRVPLGKLPTSPLAKIHFDQQTQDVQMRLLGPDGASVDPTSPVPTSATVGSHDRTSKVSFVPGTRGDVDPTKVDRPSALRAGTGTGGSAGLLDVPYEWEPLPELTKDREVRRDDRTP